MKKSLLSKLTVITLIGLVISQFSFAQTVKEITISSAFDELRVSIPADVYVKKGETTSVRAEGHEDAIAALEFKFKEDALTIRKVNKYKNVKMSSVKIYITTPKLGGAVLSGSGNIIVEDMFSGDDFDATISGSGNINAKVDVKDIDATISGSGNITLEGSAESADFSSSGSGNMNAFGLQLQDADVSIMGSGNANVNVSKSLDVSIMGSGNVTYIGSPELDVNKMGSGKVAARK